MTRDNDLRAREIAATPRWYNPWLHLAVTSTIGLGSLTMALALIRHLRAWELATIPLTWVLSNAVEWSAHRNLLHKRSPLAPVLYDRHTPIHHRIYVTGDMEIRDCREFRLVLIPAYGILLILVATFPATWLLVLLGVPNIAALFCATCMGYAVSYELLHLAYHLPLDSWVGRRWLVRLLRNHHARHHDPTLMQRWNFNVTVPFWDWVRGTIWNERDRAERCEWGERRGSGNAKLF